MGTSPGIRLSNLGPGSKCLAGTEFLKLPRNWWPLKAKVSTKVPKEEIRKRPLELKGFAAAMKGRVRELNKDGMEPLSLLGTARRVLETATLWSKAQGTLARVLWERTKGNRAQTKEDPGEREMAKKLLLLASQGFCTESPRLAEHY